uniref:THAP domain-containing protein 1 n=1 Tax=Monopterus albus TaxID=43700 RepID=A0A3Q3JLC5_MONAL
MVHKCCVDSCWNTKRANLTFHRFPLGDAERLRQWLFALNMDVKTPLHILSKLFVCQKHFQHDDYYDAANQPSRRGRLLKPNAVPTQFRHTHTSETGGPTAHTRVEHSNK